MKKFTVLLSAFLLMLIFSINVYAEKNILIENLTGTWCGPCGSYKDIIHQLIDDNEGRVFVCEMHLGGSDPYKIPESDTISGIFGNGGVPSGTLNREPFNVGGQTAFALHPANWGQVVPQMLQGENVVDVQVFYSVNKNTRQLSATVQAEFLKALSIPTGEFRFNLYINESNIIGYQANKGNDYNHQNVCRDVLGGVFGLGGIIPATVKAGDSYEYTFTYNLNPAWNIDNLDFYGCVLEYGTNGGQLDGNYVQILNSAKAIEGVPYSEVTSTGPSIAVKPAGEAFSKIFNLKNLANEQITFRINDDVSTRTPADWTWQINAPAGIISKSEKSQSAEVKVNAGASVDITVEFTPGTTIGAGDLNLEFINKYDLSGQKSSVSMSVVSAEIENMQIVDFGGGSYSIKNQMGTAGLSNVVDLSGEEFSEVGSLINNLRTVVWNCGDDGEISASEASDISSAISDGANMLIMGGKMGTSINTNAASLLSYLGIQWRSLCRQGSSTQGAVTFEGYADDPITDGLSMPGKIYYYTQALRVTGATTFPILKHRNTDTVVATRTVLDDTRIVYIGTNPFYITSSYDRDDFLGKCIQWLQGLGPSISCAEDLAFSNTETGQITEETLVIENKGKSPMTVTDIEVEYDYATNFLVKGTKSFTVPANGTYDLVLQFKPSYAIQYDSWIRIYSNAENAPIKQVNVSGTGTQASAGPIISLNVSEVDFVDVPVGETDSKTFRINNTGNQSLNVTNITVPGAYAPLFTVDPTSFTVAQGANQTVTVTFNPTDAVSIETNLTITSNNKNGSVQLPLNASAIVGVEEGTRTSALMNINAVPNPFNENSRVEFILNGDMSQQVEIIAIDETGRTIKTIANRTFEPGTYTFDLNSSNIASGTYYIVAKTKDYTAQLPIVVVK